MKKNSSGEWVKERMIKKESLGEWVKVSANSMTQFS